MALMRVSTMNNITGILAIIAAAGAVLLVLSRLIDTRLTRRFLDRIHPLRIWLAFLVAAVATAGSLWYSESADFTPCKFCWLQRIFMYSSAVVLLVAALRKDHRGATFYVVPLATIGLAISIYHNLLEHNPQWESTSCSATVPCATPYFKTWGWLTLAGMAFAGFIAILALLLMPRRSTSFDDHRGIDRMIADQAVVPEAEVESI